MKWAITKSKVDRLCQFDLSKFYILDKGMLRTACFYMGMLLLYFGSLHPWFLWPLKELYPIPAAMLLLVSYLLSNSMRSGIFERKDYAAGTVCYFVLAFYMVINNGLNVNSYIVNLFSLFCIFLLLKTNIEELDRLTTFLAKSFAVLLIPSIFFFFLYLGGFGMPSVNMVFGDNQYSFSNYFFFMIDDRSLTILIPRFQSVFLEPGHLGSATTVLLLTQIGRWKKWWNIVLILASVISFSLAAYAILIAIMFLSLWMQRKHIVGKLVAVVVFLSLGAVVASTYNGGDNLVNNLILARLEVDDKTGDIAGNNRVDENFEKEFDKFVTTSDVYFGRDMSKVARGSGNSGYRVFIYQNGLCGLLLVVLFYALSFRNFRDVRYLLSTIVISVLIFWIRGYPLWYSNFIPLFVVAYQSHCGVSCQAVLSNKKS